MCRVLLCCACCGLVQNPLGWTARAIRAPASNAVSRGEVVSVLVAWGRVAYGGARRCLLWRGQAGRGWARCGMFRSGTRSGGPRGSAGHQRECGRVRHRKARHGSVRLRSVWQGGVARCAVRLCRDGFRRARLGNPGLLRDRYGKESQLGRLLEGWPGTSVESGSVWFGGARLGEVRLGRVWRSTAW